jgi:hypothetical protein
VSGVKHLCAACGTEFPPSERPPDSCPICADPRQYVAAGGQRWTSLDALRLTHRNAFHQLEPDLHSVGMTPEFAIAQRALVVRSAGGNVLWDCIPLLDDATIEIIRALGGLHGIAISHPHYYSTMVEWAHTFDCPVYLHAADRQWVMRPDPVLRFWDGEVLGLHDGLTLIRCGGHFEGGTVLHWPAGARGRGALLSGDIIQVVSDRRWVSFMRSYPNLIPLPVRAVRAIANAVEPYEFDCLYGAFADRHVLRDAKAAVGRSADRYIAAIAP